MVHRRDLLEPQCWPLCCGCLPLYGFLKGVLCAVPCTIYMTLATTLCAIILIPHDVFLTYRALATTHQLGPNIKVVIMILLPIPLTLWPVAVLMASLVFSFFYSLGAPVYYTFREDKNFFYGGIPEVFKRCFGKFPKEFWKYNYESYFGYLEEYRHRELKEGEEPFDVPLHWILVGPFYAFIGIVVAVPAAFVIGVLKYFPGLVKAYYKMWKGYWSWEGWIIAATFLVFIVVNVVLPIIGVLVLIAFIFLGVAMGLSVAGVAFKKGSRAGFQRVANNIYNLDEITNKIIFEADSCMQCLKMGEDFV